jgi:hypothetical protein
LWSISMIFKYLKSQDTYFHTFVSLPRLVYIVRNYYSTCQFRNTVLAPVFAHPVISRIRILHVKCKIIGTLFPYTTLILKYFEVFLIRIALRFLTFQCKRSVNKPTLDFWQMLQRPVISRMILKMNKGKILFWKFSKLKFIPVFYMSNAKSLEKFRWRQLLCEDWL